jgi:hypothetical protein
MELFRALAALAEPPTLEHCRLAAVLGLSGEPDSAQYADTFLFQLYPYASVYLGREGMLGGEARDRIAGFWRALGLMPPPEPDHLAALLGLYATLVESEDSEQDTARKALWRRSRKALLWEHLASWLFPYIDRLLESAPACYKAWGEMLRDVLLSEIAALGQADSLPLHLREAPEIPESAEALFDESLPALLSPVRSGVVLVRADLTQAARDIGLGCRIGERKFMLRSLLSQDAAATLEWVRREAERQGQQHLRHQAALGAVASFWAGRASHTARMLARL